MKFPIEIVPYLHLSFRGCKCSMIFIWQSLHDDKQSSLCTNRRAAPRFTCGVASKRGLNSAKLSILKAVWCRLGAKTSCFI